MAIDQIGPGFWWVIRKGTGALTIVEVSEVGGELAVMFLGNVGWPDLDEAKKFYEFVQMIERPSEAGAQSR